MKKLKTHYVASGPSRRPLKIFPFDPLLGRTADNRISIDVANEPLNRGPQGRLLSVIDYDATHDRFYEPVDLDDAAILMSGGLDPTESDPRFHQQMVYAVAMKVIENFERALGRRLRFRGGQRLKLLPHAFEGANAFYDPQSLSISFGYFRADVERPGLSLPGQLIFTCLSHDIIAHEMTHAITGRLREHFGQATNPDVFAFHEGLADIVAIFQHFTFPDILRRTIQQSRADLRRRTPLVELAMEFGHATGSGTALRSALDPTNEPDPTLYDKAFEPHERGSILVAAMFDAFFTVYQHRIRDLIRIATGGTGRLEEGDLHPDLVARVAGEATRTAQGILTSSMRAFEYLPPVDVTFGDYLRALVTADYELAPDDPIGQRAALIEAFRRRGIYPLGVRSLAEDSLVWEQPEDALPLLDPGIVGERLATEAQSIHRVAQQQEDHYRAEKQEERYPAEESDREGNEDQRLAYSLHKYAKERDNARQLLLDPDLPIEIQGFHSMFRVGGDGQLRPELVAQFVQRAEEERPLGGLRLKGGTTVVFSAEGQPRYVIAKPLTSAPLDQRQLAEAKERCCRTMEFVADCDSRDPRYPWAGQRYLDLRMLERFSFSAVHHSLPTRA
jgi:hypothetical protein